VHKNAQRAELENLKSEIPNSSILLEKPIRCRGRCAFVRTNAQRAR
jgi:hypothetical protein